MKELVDFWIGLAVAGLLTVTAGAWANHDAIGKFQSAGALTNRLAQFGENVRRHLFVGFTCQIPPSTPSKILSLAAVP
jgi:hypothetical protein